MARICLECQADIGKRQDQLKCDICECWQHRTCRSGMTRPEYRQFLRCNDYNWRCFYCTEGEAMSVNPDHNMQDDHSAGKQAFNKMY